MDFIEFTTQADVTQLNLENLKGNILSAILNTYFVKGEIDARQLFATINEKDEYFNSILEKYFYFCGYHDFGDSFVAKDVLHSMFWDVKDHYTSLSKLLEYNSEDYSSNGLTYNDLVQNQKELFSLATEIQLFLGFEENRLGKFKEKINSKLSALEQIYDLVLGSKNNNKNPNASQKDRIDALMGRVNDLLKRYESVHYVRANELLDRNSPTKE